MTEGSLQENLR